ncbi:NUDIX hydrolase [Streptomyces clavuligerus]|uniref:NUDIX hydrolase n=2 Tax=Streptomyces clavuligerus TaxID=1901 RepID=D5SJ42_STRCL|nr:NUDIX hydrolase [Streptomyces clavuligerus]EFG03935.1 NUDIX hydrolase [Streptomyces clavuligerus]MBY6307560.1 NUDIX hydrolase [Streptomyces clavuligerus]QCS09883.1 NUDIX hydrolase [Streptomyces clavuligerus]QPJ98071.1 NUDIX domain-containing protein [Streptomyces clavuligerus]WDN56591.1 NUDIX hydrolase [Streptomyces clavuligerus]
MLRTAPSAAVHPAAGFTASHRSPGRVTAVITRPGRGEVLLVARRGPGGALRWQLPTSGIRSGETAAAAARRAALDDTGVRVDPDVRLEHTGARAECRQIHMVCTVTAGVAYVPPGRGIADVAWVSPTALTAYLPRLCASLHRLLNPRPVPGLTP